MNEIWKTIEGYEYYEVSNLGRVRSWRGNGNGTRAKKSKILVSQLGTNGRPKYELACGNRSSSGKTKSETKYEHTLVCEAFIGPRPQGMEIRHLDGDVNNNNVSNLLYGTHQENIEDKKRHGTFVQGSASNLSKLSEKDVLDIRSSTLTPQELADKFNVTRDNIYLILSRQTWRHI